MDHFHGAKNPSCLIGLKQFRSIIKRLMVHGSSSTKCFLNLFKLKAFRILLNGSSGLVIKAGTDLIEFSHPREDIDTDLLVEIQ